MDNDKVSKAQSEENTPYARTIDLKLRIANTYLSFLFVFLSVSMSENEKDDGCCNQWGVFDFRMDNDQLNFIGTSVSRVHAVCVCVCAMIYTNVR